MSELIEQYSKSNIIVRFFRRTFELLSRFRWSLMVGLWAGTFVGIIVIFNQGSETLKQIKQSQDIIIADNAVQTKYMMCIASFFAREDRAESRIKDIENCAIDTFVKKEDPLAPETPSTQVLQGQGASQSTSNNVDSSQAQVDNNSSNNSNQDDQPPKQKGAIKSIIENIRGLF